MSPTLILQLTANGIVVGSLLALVALGVALIFGVMRVVNFAHGEFVTLGAFTTFLLVTRTGLSPLLGIPLAFAVGAFVGALVQRVVLARAVGRPELDVLMVTYALSIIGLGLFSSAFGGDFRSYSEGPTGNLSLGGVVVGWRSVSVLVACVRPWRRHYPDHAARSLRLGAQGAVAEPRLRRGIGHRRAAE